MKRIGQVIIGLVLVYSLVSMVIVMTIYSRQFPQFPRPDETVTAQLRYEAIAGEYPRETVGFLSGQNLLQGYVYDQNQPRGLLVLAHGIGGGADSYLPQIRYFVDQGWQVFAYDGTGSYDSEGDSTRGFPQALLDLDAALQFIQTDERFANQPVVLFGHSWGGYAAACALHLDYEIQGVVTVSAANSAMEMVMEQGHRMMGNLIETQRPFLWLYQRLLFGSVADLRADQGILEAGVPVLIVHGSADAVVSYTGSAIISNAAALSDAPVQIIQRSEPGRDGHNDLFRSKAAIAYYDEVNQAYRALYEQHKGEIPYTVEQEFYRGIDRDRIQELDVLLMNEIHAFLVECVQS